ncbi:type 2 lantibiotic, SP_1948 family [Butyrivibrio fibrisolvens DSM 3071]|uniref:Type 2 lantibiotic, SP_1948 family n=1 Tax=Butyrivibrio fibrisolvens DSM 3071 TaxID=1121131 RepID=A0A1M5Q4A9_BUTFI|nr:lichenicidin A2 family type 2 lantibiotic [Butyrivibrio fibrisolvens]SHH08690.1 type 2 lantibiotic, SP_1948 family [Butyrivibrio fibrisolvens DSM 3071]
MTQENMNRIVGETFEDMSVAEMTMVQGSGDLGAEFTTSPACVALTVAAAQQSSNNCAVAISGSLSAIGSAVLSAIKC